MYLEEDRRVNQLLLSSEMSLLMLLTKSCLTYKQAAGRVGRGRSQSVKGCLVGKGQVI